MVKPRSATFMLAPLFVVVGCGELLFNDDDRAPPDDEPPRADPDASASEVAMDASADVLGGDEPPPVDASVDQDASPADPIVFVTKGMWTGAQPMGYASWDALCTSAAHAAGHAGDFVAWVSTASSTAASRLAGSTGPWRSVEGTLVTPSIGALNGVGPLVGIKLDEHGDVVSGTVWTGTHQDGTASTFDCSGWGTAEPSVEGSVGQIGAAKSPIWTRWNDAPCDVPRHVYCFQK